MHNKKTVVNPPTSPADLGIVAAFKNPGTLRAYLTSHPAPTIATPASTSTTATPSFSRSPSPAFGTATTASSDDHDAMDLDEDLLEVDEEDQDDQDDLFWNEIDEEAEHLEDLYVAYK